MSAQQQITPEQRAAFALLADEMIPPSPTMPSATGADAHGCGLDAVLRSRPDLIEALQAALDSLAAAAPGAGSALEWIRAGGHEDDWAVLQTVVVAAYFLQPAVREALGYPGQEAIPVDKLADDIDPRELAQVRLRGAIYRPTPPA